MRHGTVNVVDQNCDNEEKERNCEGSVQANAGTLVAIEQRACMEDEATFKDTPKVVLRSDSAISQCTGNTGRGLSWGFRTDRKLGIEAPNAHHNNYRDRPLVGLQGYRCTHGGR